MDGRFWLSVIALTLVSLIFGFVVHGMLLAGDYQQVPNLMRTPEDAQGHFLWMVLAHLSLSIGLTWVYRQGRAESPWLGQGLRFGAAMATVTTIPMYLIFYAVQPWPGATVGKQIGFDVVCMLLLGIVAAAINTGRKPA